MHPQGTWFRDEQGRALLLRGVNLGGSSKVPRTPNGASHLRESLTGEVSFVGRPFPLEEADEHLRRLHRWGLRVLRLLTPWEAIEHAGPGRYDEAYLDYVQALVERAAHHGLSVFLDPHQDVWSRWTGGDGAPRWTLEVVGLRPERLHATGAAFVHAEHGGPPPAMIWVTNYARLGCATLFTLFFAGNRFAPHLKVHGEPVQEFLQRHYTGALAALARRLRGLPNVLGYDTLNEPGMGYIGVANLAAPMPSLVVKGASPTPYQGMLAASGHAVEVELKEMGPTGPEVTGHTVLNPEQLSAWGPAGCVWKQHGVWTDEDPEPRLLRPDYFAGVDFYRDCFKPFLLRVAQAVRAEHPQALLFLEGPVMGPHLAWSAADPGRVVHAPHWYDGMTLFTKHYQPEFSVDFSPAGMAPVQGREAVRQLFARQLAAIRRQAEEHMGGVPTLIGEVGLPFASSPSSSTPRASTWRPPPAPCTPSPTRSACNSSPPAPTASSR